MLNPEIALDPGTSGLRIYIDGKGVVVNEPSSIAVDVRDEAVLASGREARQLVDRAARVVEVREVFSWGKVQNFPMASYLLNKHIKKIASGRISLPAAYISAPDDMTSVERQAFVEIMEDNGIHKVYFLNEGCCAALGAGRNIFTDDPVLVLDMGKSRSSCTVCRKGVPEVSASLNLGGKDMDEALIRMVLKKYGIQTGHLTIEDLKMRTVSALTPEKDVFCEVRGMDIRTCMPKKEIVSSADSSAAISGILGQIADLVLDVMAQLDDNSLKKLAANGLTIVGGGAKIDSLDRYMHRLTGLNVFIPTRPELAAINGASRIFDLKDKRARNALIRYKGA